MGNCPTCGQPTGATTPQPQIPVPQQPQGPPGSVINHGGGLTGLVPQTGEQPQTMPQMKPSDQLRAAAKAHTDHAAKLHEAAGRADLAPQQRAMMDMLIQKLAGRQKMGGLLPSQSPNTVNPIQGLNRNG